MKYINIDGTRVRILRQSLNLTQDELAQKLSISKQAISKIELKGPLAKVQDNNLQPLADGLGCSVDYLIGKTNHFNESIDSNGNILRKGLIKSENFNRTGTDYDLLPVETQILITEIINEIMYLDNQHLSLIKKLCKVIAEENLS